MRKTSEEPIYKFFPLARKGTEVVVDQEFSDTLYPIYSDQTSIGFKFYYTTKYDAKYCDEPEMMPDIYLGLKRPVLVTLCFGQMELIATVKNQTNGKLYFFVICC